jgi:hypothetical protein
MVKTMNDDVCCHISALSPVRNCGSSHHLSCQLLQLPNPPTNPSPPLENPTVTQGEDNSEGMLVNESVERLPEEASEEPNEIERILDELTDGISELTLVWLSEEDAKKMSPQIWMR